MGYQLLSVVLAISMNFLLQSGLNIESTAIPRTAAIEIEITAYESIANAKNWSDVYDSYKSYKEYDDGYIAEAYSDIIVKMMASNWETIDQLFSLMSRDDGFKSFVLKHISPCAAYEDLEKSVVNCISDCPTNAENSCKEV